MPIFNPEGRVFAYKGQHIGPRKTRVTEEELKDLEAARIRADYLASGPIETLHIRLMAVRNGRNTEVDAADEEDETIAMSKAAMAEQQGLDPNAEPTIADMKGVSTEKPKKDKSATSGSGTESTASEENPPATG